MHRNALIVASLCFVSFSACTDDSASGGAKSKAAASGLDATESDAATNDMNESDAIANDALEQELRTLVIEALQAQQTEATSEELLAEASQLIADATLEARELYPGYLVITEQARRDLQEGRASAASKTMIGFAAGELREFEVRLPTMTETLLAEYEADSLSPIRVELLAHLLELARLKLEKALGVK